MALAGWQRQSAINARQQMEQAWGRRNELLNPTAPQLPQGAMRGMESLVGSYNQAYGAAKAANEQRYQEMLGIADTTVDQRSADIYSRAGEQRADMMQQLARLGMSKDIGASLGTGIEREARSAVDRSKQELQGTRLRIMERRTDAYPDLGALASVFQSIGTGYGGEGLMAMLQALGKMQQ